MMNDLFKLYKTNDKSSVELFLLKNKELINVLLDGEIVIKSIFGINCHLYLVINNGKLILVIKSLQPDQVIQNLEKQLFDEWFIGKIKLKHKLDIKVESENFKE